MLFGKTILITGVSSGIGARTAELASQLGADIVGIDLKPPVVPISSFIQADISSPAAIDELVTRLPKRIDALCNVAGVSGTLGAAKTLAINFYGLRALSEAVAPNQASIAKNSTAPRIGPSNVPRPPTSTMKII